MEVHKFGLCIRLNKLVMSKQVENSLCGFIKVRQKKLSALTTS